MKVYLAHPITDYGGQRQSLAIALLRANAWEIENPDQPHHAEAYRTRGMEHFREVVAECDGLAFLRFPNGTIGAGVASEVEVALSQGLLVWDISNGRLESVGVVMPSPVLSIEETRDMIAALKSSPPTPDQGDAA